MITIVAAVGENNELARDNQMLWSLPDDYQRFKLITKGFPVIMGRKSVETMLDILDERTVFAVSRNSNYHHERVITVNTIEDAIEKSLEINEQVFIIGGVYSQNRIGQKPKTNWTKTSKLFLYNFLLH